MSGLSRTETKGAKVQRQWVLDRIEEVEYNWARDLLGNVDVGKLVCRGWDP